jgi:hypothetical protein
MTLNPLMMRPNFANFLKKLYEMTEGQLQTIDRNEVGRVLGLDKEQTDHLVDQLSDIGMIKKVIGSKIILSPEAKEVLDAKKESD